MDVVVLRLPAGFDQLIRMHLDLALDHPPDVLTPDVRRAFVAGLLATCCTQLDETDIAHALVILNSVDVGPLVQ